MPRRLFPLFFFQPFRLRWVPALSFLRLSLIPYSAVRPHFIKPGCCSFVLLLNLRTATITAPIHRRVFAMSSWDPVYRLVKQLPRGWVLSYGAVAKLLRLSGGARSAGRAMAASPSGKGIPWHRVLGADGKLLIREPYSSLQKKLLESEGITVIESRIDMKRHLWTPPTKAKKKPKKEKASRKRIRK
jgi:methylated-DNA-protein-cysteine methyltransferase related protein